ncbi:Glycosyltransferase AglE [uncultured archaeon]|nr:Glycosyltransferase AglE [uncultured archaeon]
MPISPYVSIIVPTYNRKDLLKKSIESLLNQTYPKNKYEIIIVDDGSTDGTEKLVKELMGQAPDKIKSFTQDNKGPASARNIGIKYARGEFIGFIDDDVIVPNNWLETGTKILSDDVDIIGGFGLYPMDLKPNLITKYGDFKDNYTRDNNNAPYLRTWNLFVKRQVFEKVGLFDETFKTSGGEDSEWCLRAKRLGYKLKKSPELKVFHHHPKFLIKRLKIAYKYGAHQILIHSRIKSKFKIGGTYYLHRFSIRILALAGIILSIYLSLYYNLIETIQGKIYIFSFLLLFSMIFLLERRYRDFIHITSLNISTHYKFLFSLLFIVEDMFSILGTIMNLTKGRTKK